jgi:osmotically-inducible protein OsmY
MKSDSQIQKDVQEELNWTPEINAAEIGVSVKNGIVTLTGDVKSYVQKIAAEKAAMKVSGVKAVAEEIKVGPHPGLEKTDKEIAQAVLDTLKWDTSIDETRILVTVDKGYVTLSGQVDWEYQRRVAKSAIERIAGVRWINNNITLKPLPGPSDIRQKIVGAYQRSATIDADMIHVDVFGSRVLLTGKVRTLSEKTDAAAAAWSAPGITVVDNELEVVPEKELAY